MLSFRILRLVSLLLLIAHYSACAFYMVGTLELPSECMNKPWSCDKTHRTWLASSRKTGVIIDNSLPEDMQKMHVYIHTLYLILQTITCVGYGDLSPQSTSERIFALGLFVVAINVFAATINSVQSAFSDSSAADEESRKTRNDLTRWMKRRKLP